METLKSGPITNLDASPIVMATTGEGLPGGMKVATDYVAPTSAVAQYSSYRLCRFPTNAKVKRVSIYSNGLEGQTTATASLDVNVAFSDSVTDGTPLAVTGMVLSSKRDGTAAAY